MLHFSRYFYTLVFFLFSFQSIKAQEPEKTVILTVSGSGKTKEDAKQSALRSAIEQAFGAFISSKTEMLNDKVVADQIASVANGNIKSFSILTEAQLPDSSWGITLKAMVSVSKLSSFVEAKGVAIEIRGSMFALNIKQQSLNELGEVKAISDMVGLLHEPMQISFDYAIKSEEPKSLDAENKNWEIPLEVTAITNKNYDFCANYIIKTIAALSLSDEEVSNYKGLNKAIFPVGINYKGVDKTYYLRKQRSINALNTLTRNLEFYARLFTVHSGIDESNGNGAGDIHNFSPKDEYSNIKIINLLSSGQQAGKFSWQDKRTLTQIEKMTGYIVKPRGIVSEFKHGGFIVYENEGHGLVAAITDLEKLDWNSAKIACDELISNGYNDWHLPTKDELSEVYSKLAKFGIGGFEDALGWHWYWSSTGTDKFDAWGHCFNNGIQSNQNSGFKDYGCNVRAVRTF